MQKNGTILIIIGLIAMFFVARSLDSKKNNSSIPSQPPQEAEWQKRQRLWKEERKSEEEKDNKRARLNDLRQSIKSIIESNFESVYIDTDGNVDVTILVNGENEYIKFNLLQTDIRQEEDTENDGTISKYATAQVQGHHLRFCRVRGDDDIFFKLVNEYKSTLEELMLSK